MLFRLLADATVLLHGAFVLFVVGGGLLVWRWPRVAWVHVPAAAWGAWVELAGWSCPLTPAENWLRSAGGEAAYTTSFVEHHLLPILYPASLSREVQWALGAAVVAINAAIYGLALHRRAGRSGRARGFSLAARAPARRHASGTMAVGLAVRSDAVELFERLEERLPDDGTLHRIALFGPESGARALSAVLVRLPAGHEFAMHTHPDSEDCFFVLTGSGDAVEPAGALPIAPHCGVWIPAGQPHGLRAGDAGMLEVGFQSPADHTVVPFAPGRDRAAPALLVAPLRPAAASELVPSRWSSVFPERRTWRHLDAEWVALRSGERRTVGSPGWECAIVVVSGEIELPGAPSRRLPAFGLVRLAADASLELRAAASPTVLVAVKGACGGDGAPGMQ